MKHDWEYKKLGEVCESDLGKTLNQSKDTGKMQSYLCSINIQWDAIDLSTIKQARFEISEFDRYSVKSGDLLICEGGDTGRAAIWEGEPMLYQNALHRVRFNDNVNARFALLYLRYLKNYGDIDSKYSKGVTIKHLVKSSLNSIPLPVPPLPTQQSIVSELDSLSKIIADCKETLKDYDALEQSIFYDMFGNPVKNEKGWEVKKLSEVTKSTGGGTPSKDVKEYWDGDIVWVSSKDMKTTYISESQLHITKKGVENSSAKMLPIGTILIVNRSGILKHTLPIAITTKELTVNQDIKALIVNDSNIDNIYLLYCLKMFSPYLLSMIKAVTVDSIDFNIIKNLNVPLPPLPLQQQFASKIEAIEQMKVETKKALQEAETLFQARMDYWFN